MTTIKTNRPAFHHVQPARQRRHAYWASGKPCWLSDVVPIRLRVATKLQRAKFRRILPQTQLKVD
jgi:hypothetical protein